MKYRLEKDLEAQQLSKVSSRQQRIMAKTIRLKTKEADPRLRSPLRLNQKRKSADNWRYFPARRTSFDKLVAGGDALAAAKARPGSSIRMHSKIKIGKEIKTPTTEISIDNQLVVQQPAVQSALVLPVNLELTLKKKNTKSKTYEVETNGQKKGWYLAQGLSRRTLKQSARGSQSQYLVSQVLKVQPKTPIDKQKAKDLVKLKVSRMNVQE